MQLAMVNFTDADGISHTQLAVVGENNVLLVDGKDFGISAGRSQMSGVVTAPWLRDGIIKAIRDAVKVTEPKEV